MRFTRGTPVRITALKPESYLQVHSVNNRVDEGDWECLGAVPRYDQVPTIDYPDTNREFCDIIGQFQELFSTVPGIAAVAPFLICTGEAAPVKVPPKMVPQAYQQEMSSQFSKC